MYAYMMYKYYNDVSLDQGMEHLPSAVRQFEPLRQAGNSTSLAKLFGLVTGQNKTYKGESLLTCGCSISQADLTFHGKFSSPGIPYSQYLKALLLHFELPTSLR